MTDEMHKHPAYQEGFKSFKKNKGKLVSPYKTGSHEYDMFERGWVQAQKRSRASYASTPEGGHFGYAESFESTSGSYSPKFRGSGYADAKNKG